MMATMESLRWPRTLFGRLNLILISALLMAYCLSFTLSQWEKMQVRKSMMVYAVGKDVGNAVAFLDRIPAEERASWLDRFARKNYQYALRGMAIDSIQEPGLETARDATNAIQDNLEHKMMITTSVRNDHDMKRLEVHLHLQDGMPLTVILSASPYAVQWSMILLLCLQLAILMLAAWLAVRVAIRPLAMLAAAADAIVKPGVKPLFPVSAPQEVFRAATAFQNMQNRIDTYLAERMQILAAIAHDLQTPITRLRLRTELMDDDIQRDKMQADLRAMQKLVEQGLAYAQVQNQLQSEHEAPCKIELDALVSGLVQDYRDTGQPVSMSGASGLILKTQPQALNRLLSNLIDNALKFGSEAKVIISKQNETHVEISVLDQGPGIPQAQWEAVMQPFVRLEPSRNAETGGAGLGLAIVQQLAVLLNAELQFYNRQEGGFGVSVRLPISSERTPG
jgi:signal transduction histidine kinase